MLPKFEEQKHELKVGKLPFILITNYLITELFLSKEQNKQT